jgi:DNA-binding winged helix-turn-helix (wHTH) protein
MYDQSHPSPMPAITARSAGIEEPARAGPGGRQTGTVERTFSFGPFRLFPKQRLLFEDRNPVRLGSRALDILIALVERSGELLSKSELIARVWPNLFVVEANLTVHVAALRRALRDGQDGSRYLVNIPGRGYRFVAPVEVSEGAVQSISSSSLADGLQAPTTGDAAPALPVALGSMPEATHSVLLIDLASLGDPRLPPDPSTGALGKGAFSDKSILRLIALLRQRKMLMVLDDCDHMIEALVEMLNGASAEPGLACAQAPLHGPGEGAGRGRRAGVRQRRKKARDRDRFSRKAP